MLLPGGVVIEGQRYREFAFKALDGNIEMAFSGVGNEKRSLPGRVTDALVLALEHLGGEKVDWSAAHDLCVADRQYLLQQFASLHLDMDEEWLTTHCGSCDELLDTPVHYSQLPVKTAGDTYPYVKVETSLGERCLHVPTGTAQDAVCDIQDNLQAVKHLIGHCLVDVKSPMEECLHFNNDDLLQIESAFEKVAPELSTRVQTQCPACNKLNEIIIDPYRVLNRKDQQLLWEVHTIAMFYHWSETDILALPRQRRKHYLQLIDSARGMMS